MNDPDVILAPVPGPGRLVTCTHTKDVYLPHNDVGSKQENVYLPHKDIGSKQEDIYLPHKDVSSKQEDIYLLHKDVGSKQRTLPPKQRCHSNIQETKGHYKTLKKLKI